MKSLVLLVAHPLSSSAAAGAVVADGHRDPSDFVIFFIVGGIFAAIGALAFSGVWRGWAGRFRIYRVLPVAFGWMGVGFLVTGVGGVLPQPVSDPVLYAGLAFAGLSFVGMAWLPRPFLPRWYKVQMGLDPGASRKRIVASVAEKGTPPLSGPLGEDLGGGEEKGFAAASRLGGVVGGAVREAPASHVGPSDGAADAASRPTPPNGEARECKSGEDAHS
ncbi:hypothetical protein [Clavibacter sp. CFBP 8614]|uniref:hypothetical protein n=1 Tax=unclassified Clavibacter TaxID=2626594 RepID=UPI0040421BCF